MHDYQIEDRLRSALRKEGDNLTLDITAGELERRLALRRRARAGRRLSLVAAGVAVIAIGGVVAAGSGWFRIGGPNVGGNPAPTSGPFASPVGSPAATEPTATDLPAPTSSAPTPAPTSQGSSIPPSPSAAENPIQAYFRGRAWSTADSAWVIGRVDQSGIRLPENEYAMAVSDEIVVTGVYGQAGPSTLRVRQVDSGAVLVRLDLPEQASTAIIAGGVVYFTGSRPDGTDPGVSALDVASGVVTPIVKSGAWPAAFKGDVGDGSRWGLVESSNGQRILSMACGPTLTFPQTCFVDVIAVAGSRVIGKITVGDGDHGLIDATDDVLFFVYSSDAPGQLDAFDIASRRTLWSLDGWQGSYATSDGNTVIIQRHNGRFDDPTELEAVDVRTGAERPLLRLDGAISGYQLWPELSDDRYAVFGPDSRLTDAFLHGVNRIEAWVFDLQSGELLPTPIVLTLDAVPVD